MSAAGRKLHLSQSAVSQTIQSLERQLGVQLLIRGAGGVTLTGAGAVLLREARTLIAQHDRALAAVSGQAAASAAPLRVGVPLEFPADLLPRALAEMGASFPYTQVDIRHAASSAQLSALEAGELDLALVRERPADPDYDAVLAVEEALGVILSAARAEKLTGPAGVRLHQLAGLDWLAFARSEAPCWHDQITATLRSHGIIRPLRPGGGGRRVPAHRRGQARLRRRRARVRAGTPRLVRSAPAGYLPGDARGAARGRDLVPAGWRPARPADLGRVGGRRHQARPCRAGRRARPYGAVADVQPPAGPGAWRDRAGRRRIRSAYGLFPPDPSPFPPFPPFCAVSAGVAVSVWPAVVDVEAELQGRDERGDVVLVEVLRDRGEEDGGLVRPGVDDDHGGLLVGPRGALGRGVRVGHVVRDLPAGVPADLERLVLFRVDAVVERAVVRVAEGLRQVLRGASAGWRRRCSRTAAGASPEQASPYQVADPPLICPAAAYSPAVHGNDPLSSVLGQEAPCQGAASCVYDSPACPSVSSDPVAVAVGDGEALGDADGSAWPRRRGGRCGRRCRRRLVGDRGRRRAAQRRGDDHDRRDRDRRPGGEADDHPPAPPPLRFHVAVGVALHAAPPGTCHASPPRKSTCVPSPPPACPAMGGTEPGCG